MSAGLWLIICACSTGRNAITTTPKTDNSSYKVVDVLNSDDEFQTVENAYEVANLDMAFKGINLNLSTRLVMTFANITDSNRLFP